MKPGSFEVQDLLRQVSRSFYLTLRVLPRSIHPQLSCAYLLARAADTIADTRLVDVGRRQEALLQLRKCVHEACEGQAPQPLDFGELSKAQKTIAGQGTPAERTLLENAEKILVALREFSPEDRLEIQRVLDTITHGQELDLSRFGNASADRIAALGADGDLDEYIYCVAGCVGEFWTKMCRAHVFPAAPLSDEILLGNGIRFGKGLQLVNILRDLPEDLRQGRCYIPEDQLSRHGLRPQDLLDAAAIGRFRPLYDSYLRQAEDHLSAGWQYTTTLPFRCMRIRLACAWPILIGTKTLSRLRSGNVLDDRNRIKLSRSEVRGLMFRSVILYPFPAAWNLLFDTLRLRNL
jgi:farnesyl-diphosphate farnesyltransferase